MAIEDAPLTYKRETVIEVLEQRLAEVQAKRAEAEAKAAERRRSTRDQLVALIDEFPEFLIYVAQAVTGGLGRPGTDEFAEKVRDRYTPGPRQDGYGDEPYDPDAHIKRLIRVYQKAEDETVPVTVDDEVYSYL